MSNETEGKCPVMHGALTSNSSSGTSNKDWWPNQLNLNILQATFLSMKRALNNLDCSVDVVLVDGNLNPGFDHHTECIVKGDSISLSIAAASIIAKVTRDNLMSKIDEEFPNYNWKKNKGYGTKEHRNALEIYGPCKYHRKSFSPINKMLGFS